MTVYFHIQSNDRIKIGYTDNSVEARRRKLQTGSGHPLICLGGISGDRSIESQFHYLFSQYKIQDTGEWYWAVPPIMDFIRKFASTVKDIDEDYESSENDGNQSYRLQSVILTSARATAILFLKNIFTLSGPSITGTEVTRRARDCGIKDTTLRRAARDLNIDIRTSERDQAVGAVGPVPWYPPREWPIIPGLERFSDPLDEVESFAVEGE